ncbi:MAG: hypothetical protein NTW21_16510 [Verrucomicrobia bacterium]|nr:hypothetical protein [Verrucomicrobiota bacterium]
MSTAIQFSSPREARTYQTGMAEVARKLRGHRKPSTQELEARTLAEGKLQVLKKLGRDGYRKLFGSEPPRTMAPATTATCTLKSYSTETGPFNPPKLHRYICKNWLATVPA